MEFHASSRTILIVVAHPDDETIAFAGLLQKAHRAIVVVVTDGAPRHHFFWRSCTSREVYAQLRRQECLAALSIVQTEPCFLGDYLSSPIADQELFKHLATAAPVLQQIISQTKPDCLFTLAYEGGHPDHDACCFLTSWIGRQMQIPVWESPLYHRSRDGSMAVQAFFQATGQESASKLEGEVLSRKLQMIDSYQSQKQVLAGFHPEKEIFRPVADYDFRRAPMPHKLNYESWGFPVSGEQVSREFASFLSSHLDTNPGPAQNDHCVMRTL